MRVAYLAAGAGGMYCGSCLHDNTLAAAMQRAGHDVALLPTYTPMKTDETSVADEHLFYGAINVYLRQKSKLFRRLPRSLTRWLDRPGLISWIAARASATDAHELGDLTLAVLRGESGPQQEELERLVAWLRDDFRPDVVHLTNSLFLGLARRLREAVGVPVVVNVQGEDLFIGQLPDGPREAVLAELRARAHDADLFIAPNDYYARHMAQLLHVAPEKVRVVPLGIRLDGYSEASQEGAAEARRTIGHDSGNDALREQGRQRELCSSPPVIGYLARICPEKGFDRLVTAFLEIHTGARHAPRLRVAGYLDPSLRPYLEDQVGRVREAGLADAVEIVGEVDLDGKLSFLREVDVLSVPTTYREAKGIFALEAMAAGTPVVLPDHGGFPELLEETGGGVLFEADSSADLARALSDLLADDDRRRSLGAAGREAVHARRGADRMAEATLAVYRELLASSQVSREAREATA